MKYRQFGKQSWLVSEVGFGAWAIGGDMWGPQDDAESVCALHKAIDLGVNFIDTAQGYGNGHSEELIGKVLKDRNDEIFVATKLPPAPGTAWPAPENQDSRVSYPAEYVIQKCEDSLRRLQRDYVDIYQFHTWAAAFNHRDEWYEAVTKLKLAGKIRAFGVSVHDTTPDSIIGSLVLDRIDAVQVIYNIFEQYPAWNLFPVCRKTNTAVIARVPFDEGALTGKYTEETIFPEKDVRGDYFRGNNLKAVIERVDKIKEYKNGFAPEMSMPDLALRFCLSHPAVTTVIPGIRNTSQAEQNTAVSDGHLLENDVLTGMEGFYWKKDFWHDEVKL